MALGKAQEEMVISLFARAFSTTEDEKSRKELYIQFADAYDGSIKDWREIVEKELADEVLREQFKQLYNLGQQTDVKEFITVEPMRIEDLEQVSYLSMKELGTMPWIKVNSEAQGCGIGKMLFERLRTNMFRNRIYGMKLMTKREIAAYKIYKHLGFEEMEDYVHMSAIEVKKLMLS